MEKKPCPCRGNDKQCLDCRGTGIIIITKRPVRGTR